MENKPSYYAVIPAEVRYANISSSAKLLYGEVTALCSKEGYCWASNRYFGELYNVSARSISEWISELKDAGFITYEIENENERKIRLTIQYSHEKKFVGVGRKVPSPLGRKVPHSITRESITYNIATDAVAGADINEIISLFKEVNPLIGKHYGNTNQRKAVERMVKEFGYEKLESMIRALDEINRKPYWPKSTTPLQLENNIPIYKAKNEEDKNKKQGMKSRIAII